MTQAAVQAELKIEADGSVESAKSHAYFERLRPMALRFISTRPHRRLDQYERTTESGIVLPATERAMSQEYGLVCTVLAVGPDCDSLIVPGAKVLVPMFSGNVIFDLDDSSETELWILGSGDVMAVLEDAS